MCSYNLNELINNYNRIIKFCDNLNNALNNDNYDIDILDIIVQINSRNDDIIKKFDYDFERLYNSITKLDSSICNGEVYKIHEEGLLREDGYEKGYIFLIQGSSIKSHFHYDNKEHYKIIFGANAALDHDFCNIGSSHQILPVNSDTLVRTYKYIPSHL